MRQDFLFLLLLHMKLPALRQIFGNSPKWARQVGHQPVRIDLVANEVRNASRAIESSFRKLPAQQRWSHSMTRANSREVLNRGPN